MLGELLDGLLNLALTPELPSFNSAKTYSLLIWIMRTQQLPLSLLHPRATRIQSVLQRAITADYGCDKKGRTPVYDGFMVRHLLYSHSTFVYVFHP
jgi:hypothetical protein